MQRVYVAQDRFPDPFLARVNLRSGTSHTRSLVGDEEREAEVSRSREDATQWRVLDRINSSGNACVSGC